MASVLYESGNTKQRFIYKELLPELLKNTTGSSLAKRRLASMNLFPFIAQDGTLYITSLLSENKPWFYLDDGSPKHTSRGSYRILADELLSSNLKSQLITNLGEPYLRRYNPRAILQDIISQMSVERDYSSLWWTKAIEVYELWDGSSQGMEFFKDATLNIENDYFLFQPSYCDPRYSKLLLSLGVFKDIMKHPNSQCFIEYTNEHAGKSAALLLRLLGVPADFVNARNECSTYLRRLFLGIRDNIYFPLSDMNDDEKSLCELSHYIVFTIIRAESFTAFNNLLSNESYRAGIVVRNRRNNYIPISYSLYFQPVSMKGQERASITDDILESLHVDEHVYVTDNIRNNVSFWQSLHANPFDGTLQYASNYNFGNIRISDGQFYRWIWHYVPDVTTARLILGWLTNRNRPFVDDKDRNLALEAVRMISSAPMAESDRVFRFRIGCSVREAVRNADLINKLTTSSTLQNIHVVINDNINKYESIQLKAKIARAIVAKPAVVSAIQKDKIWDNIFSTEELRENRYITAWSESETNFNLEDEPILLVSADSVEKSVLQYIGKKYHIDVSKIDLSGKNYQQDFRDLIFDIRTFVSSTREYSLTQSVGNAVIPLQDMLSADKELKLWHVLKTSREVIWNSDKTSPNTDYNVFSTENFLKEKYRGHCQICGETIPRDVPEEQFEFMLADKPENTFSHALHNILCLCPACHSDLRMGYGKRDLSSIARTANQYIARMEQNAAGEIHSRGTSVISQFAKHNQFSEGFSDPIVCEICANGKEERIFFSWEHFMRISLAFYNPEQDYQYSGEIGNLMQLLRMLST